MSEWQNVEYEVGDIVTVEYPGVEPRHFCVTAVGETAQSTVSYTMVPVDERPTWARRNGGAR